MRCSSMAATQPMHTLREAKMRGVLLASIAFGLVASSAAAQDRKGIRFWNLTLYTITTLQMSPAGEYSWGPDQCKGVCIVRNVEVKEGAVFSIEEKQLTDCRR